MKRILGILVLGALLISHPARAEDEWTPATPIRQGKIRGELYKQYVHRGESGLISVRSETICRFESSMPVYDVRGRKEYYATPDIVSCESSVGSTPITIKVIGLISISDGEFLDEKFDVKSAHVHFYVSKSSVTPQPIRWPESRSGYTSTRDLTARGFILNVSRSFNSDEANVPVDEEDFGLAAELIDDAQ